MLESAMTMGLKSKVRSLGLLAALCFYIISGILCLAALALDFRLVHMALIGALSLISAFGLFMEKGWALWIITILFFTATTFSVCMLYYTIGSDLALSSIMLVYLFLTWIFAFHSASRKRAFEKG